jgi:hypothetical protein
VGRWRKSGLIAVAAGPADPLRAAERAFELGDFRAARLEAQRCRGAATTDAERAAADALLARMAYDPAILWLTAGCVALFLLVLLTTLGH